MKERDQQIHELYADIKDRQQRSGQRRNSILGKLENLTPFGKKHTLNERRLLDDLSDKFWELIRTRPGQYPLENFRFFSNVTGLGFQYSFKYNLSGEEFEAGFSTYNYWGFLAQKHSSDFSPEIEIIESKTPKSSILHLPEGFQVPVGPVRFVSESVPVSEANLEADLEADKAKAIEIAKAAGIKVPENLNEIFAAFERFIPKTRSPGRFFYWQPILPDTPTKIAIDFDKIEPRYLGLQIEGAPVINNTKIIENDF